MVLIPYLITVTLPDCDNSLMVVNEAVLFGDSFMRCGTYMWVSRIQLWIGSHGLNYGFAHFLYKDEQEICKKMKANISLILWTILGHSDDVIKSILIH